MNKPYIVLLAVLQIALTADVTAASPAAGESYVYRVTNGYSNEVRGQVTYTVDKIDTGSVTVSVTPDAPSLGVAHTEIYALDGNWLRHPLISHDRPVDFEFSPAYPAYVFPLDIGKSWSLRVAATNPATGKRNSVRVDSEVLGTERVSVPAGAYDTVKVSRRIYAGDGDGFLLETNIEETDWYAPALGRAVRSESKSRYIDQSRISRVHVWNRGDWNVFELVGHTRK